MRKEKPLTGDNESIKSAKNQPGSIAPELENLLPEIEKRDKDLPGKIAQLVIDDFEADLESRSEWDEKRALWVRVFNQMDSPITQPWPNSSDDCIPILTEACNQFQARTYKAFFPSRLPIGAVPVGMKPSKEVDERAKRIAKFMSWQLLVKNRHYKRDKNALILSVAIHGSMFTKTYYDPVFQRNVIKNVRAEDLIVPYGIGARHIEDVERKTEMIRMTVHRSRVLARSGYFTKPLAPSDKEDPRQTTSAHDDAEGVQDSGNYLEPDCGWCLEQHRLLDLDGDGIGEPYIVFVDYETAECLRIAIRYDTTPDGTPTNAKHPIEYYTHYQFFPNPDGFYGLGLGHLLAKGNVSANKMLRQFIDAATLANIGNMSGFINETLAVSKGEVALKLGELTKVAASNDDIQKGIKLLQFPGPSNALFDGIKLIDARATRLGTVSDVTTGQVDKVLQPTTVETLEENALQVFTSVQEFLLESWTDELQKIYRLNALYLSEREYASLRTRSGMESFESGRKDFQMDYLVYPVADPRLSTEKQRQQRATNLYQIGTSNPLIMNNPAALHAVTRRTLEALDVEDIDEILPPLPPELAPPPEPQRIENQDQENMLFLMPPEQVPPFDVFPDQNHQEHLLSMDEFEKMGFAKQLKGDSKKMFENHRSKHLAFLYGQAKGMVPKPGEQGAMQNEIGPEPSGPGPSGSMAPPSDDSLYGGGTNAGGPPAGMAERGGFPSGGAGTGPMGRPRSGPPPRR